MGKAPGFFGRLGEHLSYKPAPISRGTGRKAPGGKSQNDYAAMLANVIKTVGIGSGLAAGATGVHAGVRAIGNLGTRKALEGSRREVIQNLSSQGGEAATDTRKKHYDQAFGVLADYAPSIAVNPVVATSLVHHMVSAAPRGGSPIIAADLIKNLADAEASIEKGRSGRGFMRPFGETHGQGKMLPLGAKISGSDHS
jgi:hypothetical protein